MREGGHDVLALDEDERLARLLDEEVLVLAADKGRIVVTHNIRHLAPIVRRWGEEGRGHAGLILLTEPHARFGAILHGIDQLFTARPHHSDWLDRVEFLGRGDSPG